MVKRSRFFSALCIGCTLLISGQSWAAIIEPGSGDLTINHGQGFKPVTSRASANVGDSVMVGPGGSATVVYDDGCKVNVQPGAVTAIAPLSPCASGSNAQELVELGVAKHSILGALYRYGRFYWDRSITHWKSRRKPLRAKVPAIQLIASRADLPQSGHCSIIYPLGLGASS